jgi:HSP20 family protein
METQVQKQQQEIPVREKSGSREQGTYQGPYFEPAVDIYETEEALTLKADLPGVQPEELQTDLRENLLTITAKVRSMESKWRPVYQEYTVGHYVRQFRVGQQIDQSKISAQLKDGVLTLTLPKADHARPRRIEVQVG